MKIKNAKLTMDSIQAINKIIELEIPIKIAWKLKSSILKIDPLVKNVDEMRKKIINEFAEKDEKGELLFAKDENGNELKTQVMIKDIDGFNKKLTELLDIENEVDIEPIKIDDLGDIKISTRELLNVDFLFES